MSTRRQAMVMLSALLMAIPIAPRSNAMAATDPFSFTQIDKQLHVAASYGLSLTTTRLLETYNLPRWQSVFYASLLTLTVGGAKELFMDKQASSGDMVANLIGTTASAALVFTFEL